MHFKKYPSLKKSDAKSLLKHLTALGQGETECVVEEKLHGANLSLWTDGVEVRSAKRTGLLKEEFYGADQTLTKYKEAMLSLHGALTTSRRAVAVFGELVGGVYPHLDVPSLNLKGVQPAVFYCPEYRFFAFDVLVGAEFLDYDHAHSVLGRWGFERVEPLYRGPLSRCIHHPNEFTTTVPARLKLPPIEDNICEGVVIRSTQLQPRLLIKHKNRRFLEEDKAALVALKKHRKQLRKLSNEAEEIFSTIVIKFCAQRLYTLRSKLGTVGSMGPDGHRRVLRAFFKDALEEYQREAPNSWSGLDPRERHQIETALKTRAKQVLDTHFFEVFLA